MRSHSVDDVLTALADERRRLVVRYLADESEGVASCGELVDYVAAHVAAPSADVSADLHHSALPLLEERDLVRYDAERGRVRYRPNAVAEDVLHSVGDA